MVRRVEIKSVFRRRNRASYMGNHILKMTFGTIAVAVFGCN